MDAGVRLAKVVDGRIPGIDLADLRRRAQALFEAVRAAHGERCLHRRGAGGLFPPAFPSYEETQR
ncbi:hypothetical protein [Streptomyces sp. NPDC058382]|uniref:hypothetical protein n=1 Tax=unclassified Streptomyces TaxID=2593676 RepID=UPI003626AFE0